MTVPQVRQTIARLLRNVLHVDDHEKIARDATRRLQRNETARFYHYHKRNSLAPKRIHQRR
jgi:hypothetical protein